MLQRHWQPFLDFGQRVLSAIIIMLTKGSRKFVAARERSATITFHFCISTLSGIQSIRVIMSAFRPLVLNNRGFEIIRHRAHDLTLLFHCTWCTIRLSASIGRMTGSVICFREASIHTLVHRTT